MKLKAWIMKRNNHEKIAYFILVLVVTYILWNITAMYPLRSSERQLADTIKMVQTQIIASRQQITHIKVVVTEASYYQQMQEQQALTLQAKDYKNKLQHLLLTLVAPEKYPQLMSDILKHQEGVVLTDLKNLPDQAWSTDGLQNLDLFAGTANIYQHGVQIEFKTNYLNAMRYLTRLEKLPWYLHWDSLEYKVSTYPDANVIAIAHVLSRSG